MQLMQFLEKICSLKWVFDVKMGILEKEKDLEINDSSVYLKKLKNNSKGDKKEENNKDKSTN